MNWIGPLFKNAGGWEAYVSYHEGRWYVIDRNAPLKIESDRSSILLLPMMQEEYGGGYEKQIGLLENGLRKFGQDIGLAKEFPIHIPILVAFKIMPGWTRFAADWVQYMNMDEKIARLLFDICQNNCIDQKVRHKVLRVVNNWTKRRGYMFIKKSTNK